MDNNNFTWNKLLFMADILVQKGSLEGIAPRLFEECFFASVLFQSPLLPKGRGTERFFEKASFPNHL